MYRLKSGMEREYRAWSSEVDQRITPGQPGMIRFEVYEIAGADRGEPFVDIVEDIEVEDFDAWMETTRKPGMAYVMGTIGRYIEEDSMRVIYGSRLQAALPEGAQPPLP
jgi:hypothetical protein